MAARLLILRAGSGSSNSLVRSLRAGDPALTIAGCHDDPFVLGKSLAERNFLAPASPRRERLRALRRIIRAERIDLVIPTTDQDVLEISALRRRIPCRVFLPRHALIERCQDKYGLTEFLRRRGIAAPQTCRAESAKQVEALFRRLAPRTMLWCRLRRGSGSLGAIPVRTPDQAWSWIRYWEEMRGVQPGSFTLSEYLPGRDFCVQCLWKGGRMVLAKMAERLDYIEGGSPSGVSSMAALAKTAFDPDAIRTCARAIRALDPRASGAFFVDMKEDERGRACITEINAGRFAAMTNLHDLAGRHNMALLYVRLAMGEEVRIPGAKDFAEDYYVVRSVDTIPEVMHADRLMEGIEDALD
jgi:carbamoyl-phosphate synthase large subunit